MAGSGGALHRVAYLSGSVFLSIAALSVQILCYVAPYWFHEPGKTLGLWAECLTGHECQWSLHNFCPVFSRVALSLNLCLTLLGLCLVIASLCRRWSARLFLWAGACLVLAGVCGAAGACAWVFHYLLPTGVFPYHFYWGAYVVLAACVCDVIAGVAFVYLGRRLQAWHVTWQKCPQRA